MTAEPLKSAVMSLTPARSCSLTAVLQGLLLALLATSCGVAYADGMRERLAGCAICHGEHGEGLVERGEYFPHLAGKPAGYLLAQMQAFRDGRRHYPRMVYLMQYMDDDWLGKIAHWYAGQPTQTQRVADADSRLDAAGRQRAERLVHEGDPSRGLHACVACHGADLGGVEPAIPALVGLPVDYIIAQFGAWLTGVRTAHEPDCMADVARSISPEDIRLVATWLSEQSLQPGRRPAPAGSLTLPTACGQIAAGSAEQRVDDSAAPTGLP